MREPVQVTNIARLTVCESYIVFFTYILITLCVLKIVLCLSLYLYMQWLNEKKVGEKKKNEKVSDYDSD